MARRVARRRTGGASPWGPRGGRTARYAPSNKLIGSYDSSLYYMFFYDKPFQEQLGVMAFLEAHERVLSEDGPGGIESQRDELEG